MATWFHDTAAGLVLRAGRGADLPSLRPCCTGVAASWPVLARVTLLGPAPADARASAPRWLATAAVAWAGAAVAALAAPVPTPTSAAAAPATMGVCPGPGRVLLRGGLGGPSGGGRGVPVGPGWG